MRTQFTRRFAWAAAAGVVMVLAGAACADTVTLREEAYVKGPTVLLGEVADIRGDNAQALARIEVAPAAIPGGAKRLDASMVLARLRGSGVALDVVVTGNSRVLATTLHLDIGPDMIAEDLRQYIRREMPWDPSSAIVEIGAPPSAFRVRDGDIAFRWRSDPQYEYLGIGSFRGEILVDGAPERTVVCQASIAAYEDVVVASANIARNDPVGPQNLRLEKRELSSVGSGVYFSPEDLRGYIAKTTIYQGQVVTDRKLAMRNLVKRNQVVEVETTVGALSIRSLAKAKSDAAIGDLVTCEALGSKEKFAGILRADGVVIVD